MEIEVSHKKVGRFLKELDYVKTKPISIPVLTNSALDKRFEYAKSHINDRFWNVCFTDESVFQLNDNRQMVWWSRSDEMRPVVEMKSDRRKVMVWGGISRKGQTPLFFWKLGGDFSVDAYEYTECLEQCLFEEMDDIIEKVTEEWENITLETINNLIDGHCDHVKKVYEAKGEFVTD